MPENLLTDLKVRSAKSTDRDWKLSDGGGLFLLVKPTGGKLWRWKYRLQGKENLFAIGGFPQVSEPPRFSWRLLGLSQTGMVCCSRSR